MTTLLILIVASLCCVIKSEIFTLIVICVFALLGVAKVCEWATTGDKSRNSFVDSKGCGWASVNDWGKK